MKGSISHLPNCTILKIYIRYNFVAKKLERRFEQVFGEDSAFIPIGLADDQDVHGLYSVADPWFNKLVDKLDAKLPDKNEKPNLMTNVKETNDMELVESEFYDLLRLPCDITKACLLSNERMTSEDHFQDVRKVKFGVKDVLYYPGDVCHVQPANTEENVSKFVEMFSLDINKYLEVLPLNASKTCKTNVGTLVKRYFNLSFVPSRSFFDLLARFASDEMEKERLGELATGFDDLIDYALRPKRNVLEVFADFRQTTTALSRLTTVDFFSWMFELIPPIRARAFSIASAQIEVGAEIQLLVAIVSYKTKIKKPRKGLCTSWLLELEPNDQKFDYTIWIRPSPMKFPVIRHAPSTEPFPPMIMIGPGTGLAPFRAYIQYRRKLAQNYENNLLVANPENLWLFYGCRFENKDFLCKEEILSYGKESLLRLETAFSRDSPDKVYVQHKIEKSSEEIVRWIVDRGAHVCISGNATQMPKDVRNALKSCLMVRNELNEEENAEKYLDTMEKMGRLVFEVWN